MSALVRKPAIGKVKTEDKALARAIYSIKERLEQIAGERGDTAIGKLPDDASLTDVVKKINQIIDVFQ